MNSNILFAIAIYQVPICFDDTNSETDPFQRFIEISSMVQQSVLYTTIN